MILHDMQQPPRLSDTAQPNPPPALLLSLDTSHVSVEGIHRESSKQISHVAIRAVLLGLTAVATFSYI